MQGVRLLNGALGEGGRARPVVVHSTLVAGHSRIRGTPKRSFFATPRWFTMWATSCRASTTTSIHTTSSGNWDLLGFDDEEIEVIATAAVCHRKLSPRKMRPIKLGAASLRLTEVLASILRVADALDRSQMGVVREIICRTQPGREATHPGGILLRRLPAGDWWLDNKKDLFEQTFDVHLSAKLIVG